MSKSLLETYLPFWKSLSPTQQMRLEEAVSCQRVCRGTVMHRGDRVCTGLLLVQEGQLRAYVLSPEGREITLYRLFERDLCLFSAPCMLRGIQFDVTVSAEQDCTLLTIAPDVYKTLMEESVAVANHLGTAREVVTRMLRYFQREGWLASKRGHITITNRAALEALVADTE